MSKASGKENNFNENRYCQHGLSFCIETVLIVNAVQCDEICTNCKNWKINGTPKLLSL